VLFSDLAGFTAFSERASPEEVARMLKAFYGAATPAARRFGGEIERLTGDGMLVSFNTRGDQPDHAVRAARTALALQEAAERLAADHPGWPRLRVGVNTGPAVVREMGGDGFVAYELCGDAVRSDDGFGARQMSWSGDPARATMPGESTTPRPARRPLMHHPEISRTLAQARTDDRLAEAAARRRCRRSAPAAGASVAVSSPSPPPSPRGSAWRSAPARRRADARDSVRPRMGPGTWREVDAYVSERLVEDDPALTAALRANAEAGLPAIDVTPAQGKLLHLLARIQRARRILEVGTLGGYSTIWLARALPPEGGCIVTLEVDPHHAAVARGNLERAGVAGVVDLRVGAALETLDGLVAEGAEPFDLCFVDADKVRTPDYVARAIDLSRPGTVIVADNVIRGGAIVEGPDDDPGVRGSRRLHEQLARDGRISATTIQTVGAKGYDGFTLGVVDG
jgi:predicted O-methyltransferase YrrM